MQWIIENDNALPLDYPVVSSIEPTTVNKIKYLMIKGENFLPTTSVNIENTTIVEKTVINSREIRVLATSNVLGNHKVTVANDSLSSDAWEEKKYLTVTPYINTGWVDYREPLIGNIQTTRSQNPTTLARAGLVSDSNGLTTASESSQLFVIFPDILIPYNASITYESITSFFVGTSSIWTGLTYSSSVNWSNPRRTCLAMNALENRSYSRCYYGKNSFYQQLDNITGVNWSNNFVHTFIEIDGNEVLITAYSRASVNYDWNSGNEGEKIFSQHYLIDNLTNSVCCPSVYFLAANSSSFLVAQRVVVR